MVLKKKENVSIKDKSELDGFFLPSIVLFIHLAVKQSDAIILPPKKNTTESFICWWLFR